MKTIDHPKAVADAIMIEIRRHKLEIAAAFDFDVAALGRSLQQREVGDPRFQVPQGETGGDGSPTRRSEVDSPA